MIEVELDAWAGLQNLEQMPPASSRGPVYLTSGDRVEIRSSGSGGIFARFERFPKFQPPLDRYAAWVAEELAFVTGGRWVVRDTLNSFDQGGITDRVVLEWHPGGQ